MALRIRFGYSSGSSLGFSIERLGDGTVFDFSTTSSTALTFTTLASAATPIETLPEGTGIFLGSYSQTYASTPIAQFTNGDYAIRIHNIASSNIVVGVFAARMYNGDDQPSDDSTVAPAWAAGSVAPSAESIATAVLTDTTSTDLATAGSLGYLIAHAPSWYVTPTIPPTASQIATAVLTDTTAGDLSITGSLGSIISTAPSWYSSGGSGGITLTTAVPVINTPNSVGDCLNAARANGFGGWTLGGTSLVLYAPDGVTPVRTFALNNPIQPTQRT